MKIHIPTILLIILTSGSLCAQSGANPFEMKHRLGQSPAMDTTTGAPPLESRNNTAVVDTSNPFEIRASQEVKDDQKELKEPEIVESLEVPTLGQMPTGKRISSNTLFWILIFMTLMFAVIINLNRNMINQLLQAWTNLNFSNLLLRDKKGPDQMLYSLLAVVFYVNAGLFLGLTIEYFYRVELTFNLLLLYMLGIMLVYAIRHATLYWLANIFSVGKEARQYSFTIHLFNILNGILLLVSNFIVVFAPSVVGNVVLYIVISLLAIQFIYRNIRGLLLAAKYIAGDRVHFFLYLCTCEIVPWILCFVTASRLG